MPARGTLAALVGLALSLSGCEFDPSGTRFVEWKDAGPGAEASVGLDVEVQRDTGPGLDVGPQCGNQTVDPGEDCDGQNLDQQTCVTQGYLGGNLSCISCHFDYTACHLCGDSAKQPDEECDDLDFGGATCGSLGLGSGNLQCTADCHIDSSGCTINTCGNGVCDAGEEGGVCKQDCTAVLFSDGFDGGWASGWNAWDDNGYDGNDTWGTSDSHVHAGSHALWCSGQGNEDYWYDNNMEAWATHHVDLTAAAGKQVEIRLWVWINTYDSSDYFRLMVSSDNGSNWTELERRSGPDVGWSQIIVSRDADAGNPSFMVGLNFHSNGSWRREGGAFVDELVVLAWW